MRRKLHCINAEETDLDDEHSPLWKRDLREGIPHTRRLLPEGGGPPCRRVDQGVRAAHDDGLLPGCPANAKSDRRDHHDRDASTAAPTDASQADLCCGEPPDGTEGGRCERRRIASCLSRVELSRFEALRWRGSRRECVSTSRGLVSCS